MSYPERFAGTWATAPDPLDFESFFTRNVTPGSTDNMYFKKNGLPVWSARGSFTTLKTDILSHEAVDETDSEMRVDEWKWSHRLASGLPAPLFNRRTGMLNQDTLRSWQRFDMKHRLENMTRDEKRAIDGKLHLAVGNADTYFLEQPTRSFCESLKQLGIRHECLFVYNRDHVNLYTPASEYPYGLSQYIVESVARGN